MKRNINSLYYYFICFGTISIILALILDVPLLMVLSRYFLLPLLDRIYVGLGVIGSMGVGGLLAGAYFYAKDNGRFG